MPAGHKDWRQLPEAGTVVGIRFLLACCKLFGRRMTRVLVRVVIFYYALFSRRAKAVSQEYLAKSGQAHDFWETYRHLLCFGYTILDRFYFVQDDFSAFEITRHGHEHLEEISRTGRGAILLGSHLGSFEVMRTQSAHFRIPINVVGDFSNAERINRVLRKVNPDIDTRLLSVSDGTVELALNIQQAIERGELVAILGDRAGHGGTLTSTFFGSPAAFPTGPYLLAATLHCPVYLTVGLHFAPNRYELYCEPFADDIRLPRGNRQAGLQEMVDRYASRLEHYCKLAPHNWFNFFPFWEDTAKLESKTELADPNTSV